MQGAAWLAEVVQGAVGLAEVQLVQEMSQVLRQAEGSAQALGRLAGQVAQAVRVARTLIVQVTHAGRLGQAAVVDQAGGAPYAPDLAQARLAVGDLGSDCQQHRWHRWWCPACAPFTQRQNDSALGPLRLTDTACVVGQGGLLQRIPAHQGSYA